ncbi:MAG: hypothetical protein SF051_07520 [Elusimicrobiota bacterium]|nr:hypothetical protein [Elusimicrobiota bacterium]
MKRPAPSSMPALAAALAAALVSGSMPAAAGGRYGAGGRTVAAGVTNGPRFTPAPLEPSGVVRPIPGAPAIVLAPGSLRIETSLFPAPAALPAVADSPGAPAPLPAPAAVPRAASPAPLNDEAGAAVGGEAGMPADGESQAPRGGVESLQRVVERVQARPDDAARETERLYGEDIQSRFAVETAPARRAWDSFVRPNELYPEKARGILAAAGEGLYASVGTERGFIGAAMAPRATHLLLMDRSAAVAEYNRMNVALLRLARDRAEYRRLRLEGSAREAARLSEERGLPAADTALLADPAAWRKWRSAQSGNPLNARSGGVFRGSNYLHDDALFARLKSMADGGRIAVTRAVFNDPASVRRLADGIDAAGVPLSVLDLSNAWWSGYLPRKALRGLLDAARAVAGPEAVLLITDGDTTTGWTYHGFMLRAAADGWQAMKRRLDKFSSGRVSQPGSLTAPPAADSGSYDRYVVPNERHPEHAVPVLSRAPAGVYASVGTERGFIGAALTPGADALLLVDRDPAVATYNRVNAALLRLASDRAEYARLRVAEHAEVATLARERAIPLRERLVLEDEAAWKAWRDDQNGHPLLAAERTGEFSGSSYLHDDALFARLKALADAGRVTVLQADLSRGEGRARLADALRLIGRPLSVLDLSNAWRAYYLPRLGLLRLLLATRASAADGSVLLLTDRAERRTSGALGWDYFGFRLDRLAARPWAWLARLWLVDPGSWAMYSADPARTLRSRYERNAMNP